MRPVNPRSKHNHSRELVPKPSAPVDPPPKPARPRASTPSEIIPDQLYLSGLPVAQSREQLVELQITHIVSVFDRRVQYPQGLSLQTLHFQIPDVPDQDIMDVLFNSTKFIRRALDSDPNARILIHCFMGISRSASVVLGFLVAETEMTLQEAMQHVKKRRSIINPNQGFQRQLEIYARFHNGHRGVGKERKKALAARLAEWESRRPVIK